MTNATKMVITAQLSSMDGATSHHASSAYNSLLIFTCIINRHNPSLNKL